jgi:leucyl-tRNA synthetase
MRFLNSVWRNFVGESEVDDGLPITVGNGTIPEALDRQMHRTIKKVGEDIEALRFNTAIAELIKLNNAMTQLKKIPRELAETFSLLLAPFAPHIAEELWERLGHEGGIFKGAAWPSFDAEKARVREIEVAVQVNGKLRGSIKGPPGMSREDAETRARKDENVARHIDGANVRRVVFVPDRLVNFVIG